MGGKTGDPALWRLDSLADDMKSLKLEPKDSKQLQQKGTFKGLFKGFSGLNSNVKGTKRQLQRLLTTQLTEFPAQWSDAPVEAETDTTAAGKPGIPALVQDTAAPDRIRATALEAAADIALHAAAVDLNSSTTAVRSMHGSFSPNNTGTIHEHQSYQEAPDDHAADADISVFMSYAATRGASFIGSADTAGSAGTATSPPARSNITDSQLAAALSYRKSHMRPMLSRKYSGMKSRKSGMRLQPSATLQRMETNNAWWELHDLEVQQSSKSTEDGDEECMLDEEQASIMPGASQQPTASAAPAPAPAPAGAISALDAALAEAASAKSSSKFGSGLLKTLGGITSGSFATGITSKLGAMFNMLPANTTPVYSKHLKKTPHTTLSTDGWTLHLLHITDTSLSEDERRNYPILMCPGLASSGTGTYDLLPKESIADFLAADGYEVWVIDLRGNGKADKQSRVDIELEWNIDDYLVQDVPACMEYVLKQSKADMLHWMGHSMGGMLGSGLCSQGGKWSQKLRSVMLVGSGCFGDGSWHVLLKKLVTPIVTFGFPAHLSCQALALLSNTPAALSVFETLFYWCPNMDKSTRRALLHTCFNFIPQRLLGQFLASHGSAEGLSSWSGNFLYADPEVLSRCKVPCLGLNGDYDLFCPAAGGAKNVDLFAGPKKHLIFGPAHGHQHHYGHFDVIVGKNASLEVWPHIQEWLDEHDQPVMSVDDLWDDLDDF